MVGSQWPSELEVFEIPSVMDGFVDGSVDVEAQVEARLQLEELARLWNAGCTYGLTLVEAAELRWPGRKGSPRAKRRYNRVKQRLGRICAEVSKDALSSVSV